MVVLNDIPVVQSVAAGAVILVSLVYVDEGTQVKEEDALTTMRRAVWGVLHDGDVVMLSLSAPTSSEHEGRGCWGM